MQFEKSEDWLVPPSSLMTCVTIRNVATDWPWACAARNEPESMKISRQHSQRHQIPQNRILHHVTVIILSSMEIKS